MDSSPVPVDERDELDEFNVVRERRHLAEDWPLIALMLGCGGVLLGLIVTVVFSTVGDVNHLAGGHLLAQRGVLGLVAMLWGVAGVICTLTRPRLAASFLVVAGALFFLAFDLYGLIASPFLLIAALLLLIARGDATAANGEDVAPPEV